ncbi:MAG: hypothetical protein RQ936_07670 [Gammaproteobacteria bacterium]|nr:hypothetical protein [Gammaproteobacteria bacterium]
MTTLGKTFSWLLMLAFLSLTVFPYHYHLHHVDKPAEVGVTAPAHVLDTHFYAGTDELGDHNDRHIIESSSDISIKSPGLQLPSVELLFLISLLLAFNKREKPLRLTQLDLKLPPLNPYSIPQLRAPPQS